MRKALNLIIKFSAYGLVVLMPVFWLPWTVEVHEFNKQYLLFFLASIGFLAWIAKMAIVRKKVVIRRTPLDIFVLVFMLVLILSSVFSVDKVSSWLGFYTRFSDSTIGALAMCLLYFLIVNNVSHKEHKENERKKFWDLSAMFRSVTQPGLSLEKILWLFLSASGLAVVAACFSVFNLWKNIPGLPEVMYLRSFNSINSSLEGLAVFLAVLVSLMIGVLLRLRSKSKVGLKVGIQNIATSVFLLVSFILLLIINFWAAWVILAVSSFSLLAIAFLTGILRRKANWLTVPIVLLLVSLFYLSGFASKAGLSRGAFILESAELPQEVILDQSTSWDVVWQSIKTYPLLGSGPGTFLINYTRFKPISVNNSEFWNVRFDRAASYFAELTSTTGSIGVLSYLSLIGMFLLVLLTSLLKLKQKKQLQDDDKLGFLPFVLAWLALLVSQFVYPQNTVLSFSFWIFTGLTILAWQRMGVISSRRLSFSFKKLPEVGLVVNVLLLILIFASAGLFYLGGRFYLADMKFQKLFTSSENVVENMEEVVNLNKYRSKYRRDLSRAYLAGAWDEARKESEIRDTDLLQKLIASSVEQARLAAEVNPSTVVSWENLGVIYRDARGLVSGTLSFALDAFIKATNLEPANPLFYRELCRLSLTDEGREWDEIISYCQKAVELKPNYLDAHVQLALAFERKGDLEKAAEQMQITLDKLKGISFQRGSRLAQAATEIYFQLGRLHFNLARTGESIRMFEQSVIITPQYANARYALGLSYQQQERFEEALTQFKVVDELVPGNENVQSLIRQLEQTEQTEE